MYSEGEKGYPWYSFYVTPAWVKSFIAIVLVSIGGGALYWWYSRTAGDPTPDSVLGLSYGVIGTMFLVLAAVLYSLKRRSHKRSIGGLNVALQWHIAFGVIGLVLLVLHSFGNFNPRSGTFALYGMIALVISGFIGRMLDRLMPRLIAGAVQNALTTQGEDRIETISQSLQDIVVHNTQEVRSFNTASGHMPTAASTAARSQTPISSSAGLHSSWDLAYITMDETPQEISRENSVQYRFVPDRKSSLTQPGALIPGAQEHISALQSVQKALTSEQFYRYVIRYWRIFHVFLVLITIGMTLWHLMYAMQLWIPALLHP